MNPRTEKTKFVLVTDNVLKPQEMQTLGITLAADDYMSKPFNLKEAVRRFNQLLGYVGDNTNILEADTTTTGQLENLNDDIEGQHTIINASVTKEAEAKAPEKKLMTEIYEEHLDEQQTDAPEQLTPNTQDTPSADNLPLSEAEEYTDDDDNKPGTADNAVKELSDDVVQEPSDDASPVNTLQMIEEEQSQNDSLGYSMLNAVDKQLIYNVEQYVAHNMSRGNISLDNMAAAMGMGRVPLFHKIKAITHKTPAELVRDLRLKHAANLLIRTPMSVSDIAVELGFMTTENFIHQFKEKFGMLPLEYQIKNRL
jgi:AraC-like DNA-binding protein/DNA-binding response OmpR family regulator